MIAPKIGPVRPYGLFGFGLMKTNVNLTPAAFVSFTNNHFAWDVGAGVMVFFGEHFGIRGDIRHFHSFQDLEIEGFDLDGHLQARLRASQRRHRTKVVLRISPGGSGSCLTLGRAHPYPM